MSKPKKKVPYRYNGLSELTSRLDKKARKLFDKEKEIEKITFKLSTGQKIHLYRDEKAAETKAKSIDFSSQYPSVAQMKSIIPFINRSRSKSEIFNAYKDYIATHGNSLQSKLITSVPAEMYYKVVNDNYWSQNDDDLKDRKKLLKLFMDGLCFHGNDDGKFKFTVKLSHPRGQYMFSFNLNACYEKYMKEFNTRPSLNVFDAATPPDSNDFSLSRQYVINLYDVIYFTVNDYAENAMINMCLCTSDGIRGFAEKIAASVMGAMMKIICCPDAYGFSAKATDFTDLWCCTSAPPVMAEITVDYNILVSFGWVVSGKYRLWSDGEEFVSLSDKENKLDESLDNKEEIKNETQNTEETSEED